MENYCKEVIIINKRQKKKYFKKKYGCNPPESIRISLTNSIAEIIKNNRDIWDRNINMSIGLGKTMQCVIEKGCDKDCDNCDLNYKQGNHGQKKEVMEMAISALEKQIPKKPVKDKYNHDCCPNCGWIVYQDEWGGRYLPHCENCGQAIDRSDIHG